MADLIGHLSVLVWFRNEKVDVTRDMRCTRYIFGILILLLAGCNRLVQPEGENVPIVCKAVVPVQTKGAGETDASALQSSGLGLFAWITTEETAFDGTTTFLQNEEFTYDNGLELWKGGVYWPFGYWISFFAYSPYSADVSTGNLRFPSSDYVSGYPRLQYTPEALAEDQVDLCLATPVMDRSVTVNNGVVPLSFSHVLTRLCIQVRWTGTEAQLPIIAAAGQTIRVISMEINNVVGTNKLTYGRTSFLWDAPAAADYDDSYTMSVANGTFQDVDLPAAGVYSTGFWDISDACLYVLPQSLSADSELSVTYGIFSSAGVKLSEETATFEIGTLAQNLWPAGMVMTYSVTIDLSGHYAVEADITYDCNAGCFVDAGSYDFSNAHAGTFLGGTFHVEDTLAGAYDTDGMDVGGSSAGGFIN